MKSVLPYLDRPGGVPPEGNVINRNLIFGEGIVLLDRAEPFVNEMEGNITMPDASFFNPATGEYKPSPGALPTPIPFGKIGPR